MDNIAWSIILTLIFALIFLILISQAFLHSPGTKAGMKKFLNKARSTFDGVTKSSQQQQQVPLQQEEQSSVQPPTLADVTRYRYHHGTNLGSIFILERWLTGSMFPEDAPGSSELAAVEAWVKRDGIEQARERFERHWREYVSDGDLDWLRDVAKCTSVRLPIGYFTLGPAYCENTPFKQVAAVYQNAWKHVLSLIERCNNRGIGILIDVHGLPGGANAQEHSGTNSGKAELWGSRRNRELATRCVCFVSQQVKSVEGCLGIQIINEAEHDARGMYDWYADVIKELSSIDCTMPVYISDGWDLSRAASWSQNCNRIERKGTCPVVVDTHLYWCFTSDDTQKSPQQITAEVWSKLHETEVRDASVADRGACQAVIGEYSCVLGDDSWAKGGAETKEDLVRKFGNAESQRYQQRAGGSFFWTYRMDWMPGGEWGFRQMTEQHAIIPPVSLTFVPDDIRSRINNAQGQRDGRRGNTWGAHCQYWDANHPGEYEHWRFEQGWNIGWDDAITFFAMRSQRGLHGADKIGMLDLWVLKRLRESGQRGRFVWEFEQGLRQGVRDLYEAVGV